MHLGRAAALIDRGLGRTTASHEIRTR